MSSYAYMKVLESTPLRYDRGIWLLSHGTIERVYDRVAELATAPGRRLLDLGCGTGGLTLACATAGAQVVGVDIDAGMLEVASGKVETAGATDRVELVRLSVMELEDRFAADSFDGAVSCLLFSELLPEERAYVLRVLRTRVRPGGPVVIADEAVPEAAASRAWWSLKRAPLVVLTWLLTQTTTHPVQAGDELEGVLAGAGLTDIGSERMAGDFLVVRGFVPSRSGGRA